MLDKVAAIGVSSKFRALSMMKHDFDEQVVSATDRNSI